ncbi:MAG: right-handed parallel beta-helix repeat-containing protein [Candidatus Eisenbacteria bacterium]
MNREHDTATRHGLATALGLGLALAALTVSVVFPGCSTSNPAGPSPSQTFLVDVDGGGDFLTIQEALNASSDGDTVLVAPGTYEGPGNRNLVFGGASVVLRGTGERDEVIIHCDGVGHGFYIGGDAEPVIENLAIANGDTVRGGGMYLEGTSPTIRNVRFVGNAAIDGGGLYCRDGSPTLEDVLFDFNTAAVQGGGILCINSFPTLDNVTFFWNEGDGSGGGMACVFSSPALTECVFEENVSYFGGAIYCGQSSPDIRSCTFVGNEGYEGSAVSCTDDSSPEIRYTIIACNKPDEALYCDDSTPYTTLSCIFDNGYSNELCGTYTTSMLYTDPLFCNLEGGDLTLRAVSQCLPENNDWGIQIGAFGEGCD